MPNLSPKEVRSKYLLYDNKICTGDEAAECRMCLTTVLKASDTNWLCQEATAKSQIKTKTG